MNLPPQHAWHTGAVWAATVLAALTTTAGAPAADASPADVDGVIAYRDLAYVAAPHERQRLDLFVPNAAEEPRALIVWIHGGAWLGGSKEDCPPVRAGFVQQGFVVASVGYRLSAHAVFPAQIEDGKAAIRWLRAHASEYHIDAAHIAVWGSSAGGHLAALLGTCSNDRTFDVGENLEFSSAVQAVCDYYGPTDFVQMNAHRPSDATFDHDGPGSPESRLVGGPIQLAENAAKVRRANPITYVDADDPPFLLVHGDHDLLVPHHQSELLGDALATAGVRVEFLTVSGGGHGDGFPHLVLNARVRKFLSLRLGMATVPDTSPLVQRATIPAVDP